MQISCPTPESVNAYAQAGYWTPFSTAEFWRLNARSRPAAPAISDETSTYTWSEGVAAFEAIADRIISAGVERDAVLLVQAPNSALLLLFRLACEVAGVLPAFLHVGFRRSEIEAVLRKVRPAGAVFSTEPNLDLSPLYGHLKREFGLRFLFTVEPGSSHGIPSIGGFSRAAVTGAAGREFRPFELTGIMTSSGTTGSPKCIEYSCWPRLASGRVYIERLKMSHSDIVLTCIPFYTGGGDMQFHTAPQIGARLIVQRHFDAEKTCQLIEREKVSGAVMVPTMLARIASLRNLRPSAFGSLRWVVSGGGMLPYDVGARFEDATGAKVIQGYGLMDYGALASHGIDDPRERRLRTSGRILPGTELQIVDEGGACVPVDQAGEIRARGPYCNGGYFGDGARMNSAWRHGFFHTGDLGRVTSDGYLILEGRSKDVIIRGGQNISAPEVEMILCRHPAIADAALVRMPDADLGERACAFVMLRPGKQLHFEGMVAFMKAQEVAIYKIPERLEVISEFPMTAAGNKVDKRALEASLRARMTQAANN